jgi:hypothetical protein
VAAIKKRVAKKLTSIGKRAAKKVATKAVDLRKERKALYNARAGKPSIVDSVPTQVIAIDGKGHPSIAEPKFEDAIAGLFCIAYGMKFGRKKSKQGPDFAVPNLEALWWVAGNKPMSATTAPADWRWTAFVAVPDFLKKADVKAAAKAAGKDAPLLAKKVALRKLREGKSVQLLHVGPYDQEGATIAKVHAFAAANGLKVRGKHHEIYLNDPAKTAPEKLKTILRLGVK